MVLFKQDGLTFEDEDNVDQFRFELDTGDLKVTDLSSSQSVTFRDGGGLDTDSITAGSATVNGPLTLDGDDADLNMDGQNLVGSIGGSPTWTGEHTFNSSITLDTGQAIEDGDGVERLQINNVRTDLLTASGGLAFAARDTNNGGWIYKTGSNGNKSKLLQDSTGGFDAISYINSSSAPGTLELTDANLDASGNDVTGVGAADVEQINSSPDVPKDERVVIKDGLNTVEIYLTDIGETASPITDAQFSRSRTPYLVRISEELSDGSTFSDLVSYSASASGTEIISSHERDNPPDRSYSSGLNEEQLSMSLSSLPDDEVQEISSYMDYGGV